MKYILIAFFAIGLIAASNQAEKIDVMGVTLQNGGFESASGGANFSNPWQEIAGVGRLVDTTAAHSGTHALLISRGAAIYANILAPGFKYSSTIYARSLHETQTLKITIGGTFTTVTVTPSWAKYAFTGVSKGYKFSIAADIRANEIIIDDVTLQKIYE